MVEGKCFGVIKRFIHIPFSVPFHSFGVVNISRRNKQSGKGYMMSYDNGIWDIYEGGLITNFSQGSQGNFVPQDLKSAIKMK